MAEEEYRDYIDNKLNPLMEELISEVLIEQPKDWLAFWIDWMKRKRGDVEDISPEKQEISKLELEVKKL